MPNQTAGGNEIAAVWSLPLGQRVEVCFRGGKRSAVAGILELLHAPDYSWDPVGSNNSCGLAVIEFQEAEALTSLALAG